MSAIPTAFGLEITLKLLKTDVSTGKRYLLFCLIFFVLCVLIHHGLQSATSIKSGSWKDVMLQNEIQIQIMKVFFMCVGYIIGDTLTNPSPPCGESMPLLWGRLLWTCREPVCFGGRYSAELGHLVVKQHHTCGLFKSELQLRKL